MVKLTLRVRTHSKREALQILRDAYRAIRAAESTNGFCYCGEGSSGHDHQDEWSYEEKPGPVRKIKGICP